MVRTKLQTTGTTGFTARSADFFESRKGKREGELEELHHAPEVKVKSEAAFLPA
jgi:hypothetical protein